jgi:hypothetical protein
MTEETGVARAVKTIRAEIVRLVRERVAALGGVDFSSIGKPWHLVTPDDDGCNWQVAFFTKTKRHHAVIAETVSEVRARWSLEQRTSIGRLG